MIISAARRHRVVRQAASWCLGYPDEPLLDRLPLIADALAEQGSGAPTVALQTFVDHATTTPLPAQQRHYVDVFDNNRRRSLYLSYWTDGDTRRRGETLTEFKQHYRASGQLVDLHGELPDYLPLVLEYAARVDPDDGEQLLRQYRPALEVLRLALADFGTPYEHVLTAVCVTLPGDSPKDLAEAKRLAASGPPTESVGLEPYDPRLLPLQPVIHAPTHAVGRPG